jgi:hypothetical protein
VLYGDSYLPIDLLPVWRTSDGGRVPTMTVMRNEGRWDKGNVVFRNGKLVLYDKSATGPATIGMDYTDYGVLVLTQEIIVAGIATGEVADLGRVLNRLSIEGRLKGHEIFERFYEVGSPDGLAEFERYIGLSPARGLNVGVTPRTTTSMPSKEEPLRVSSQGLAICLLPVDVESLGLAGQLLPLVPRARDPARSMPRRLIRLRRGQRARMRRGSELGCLTS